TRNIPQTCLAGTILFHGCEFCLLCIFTHDASKGCIQPSGVTPLERGNENLSRTPIYLMSQNRRVTQSVTKGISVSKNATKRGTVAPKNGTLARPGTRDTSCNHSYRAAREPFYG
ncbi:hypothetical protein, partial [Pseudomonas syringae]|uniref:hypothetical protein n=3 Tax=Pseudomonas syringae TaxID=317 RepID=UPI001CA5BD24